MIEPDRPMRPHERRWPASLTVVVVLAMQVAVPSSTRGGPRWLLPVIEIALLLPVLVTNPTRLVRDVAIARWAAVSLAMVMSGANAVGLLVLIRRMIEQAAMTPRDILLSGLLIWTTNVAATAVAFWEADRGGPFARDPLHGRDADRPDLLFPQMTGVPGWDAQAWRPSFADYLFVSFTAATAFSPTDTLPLSVRAKALFTLASGVSLLTIGVLLARAVNVL